MTIEHRCVLAEHCNFAGIEPHCNTLCAPFTQMHSTAGRHTLANLPKEYELVTLATSPARSAQAKQYKDLRRYADTFSQATADVRSVYLYSAAPGTGKTTTAAALLNEWLAERSTLAYKQGGELPARLGYFLDVNEWQSQYNAFNRPRVPEDIAEESAQAYYRAAERAKAAPLAVLDDIGVRDVSDAFRADLHDVINSRVVSQKPTVYTSNVKMDDLAEVFGEQRLADRIRMNTLEIPFNGESKRGLKQKAKG